MHQSINLYRQLFANSSEPLLHLQHGRIVDVNRCAWKLLGRSGEGLIGSLAQSHLSEFTCEQLAEQDAEQIVRLRKKSEQDSQEDLAKSFQPLGELGKMLLYSWDIRSGAVWRSPAVFDLLGYRAEELNNDAESWGALIHPEDFASLHESGRINLQGNNQSWELEYRIRHRDGSYRHVLDRARKLFDGEGQIVGVQGVTIDITQQKKTQLELRDANERMKLACSLGNVSLWSFDPDTGATHLDPQYFAWLGLEMPTNPLLNDFFNSRIDPHDWQILTEQSKPLFEGKAATVDHVYRIRHEDGSWRWFHARGHSLVEHGKPIRFFGATLDVTERREAELAKSRLLAILEHCSDIISVSSPQGQILYVNPAGRRQLGIPDTADLGKLRIQEAHPEWAAKLILEVGLPTAMAQGEWLGETALYDAQKREFPISQLILSHKNSLGEVDFFSTIIRDLSDRVRNETELRETQKLESLGLIAGGIAHKFNNLLTTVLGYASLGRDDTDASSPSRMYFEQIEESSTQAAEICRKMLAFAGRDQVAMRPRDLNQLIREHTPLVKMAIAQRSLEMELANSLPTVNVDGNHLGQVLVNLVANAAESMEERPGSVCVRTFTRQMGRADLSRCQLGERIDEGEYVVLEVSDAGCGMTEEVRKRMFEPFFTTKFLGRGLGLAAVQGIVRSHQGALEVINGVEAGTTVRVYLPAQIAKAESTQRPPLQPSEPFVGTILIVEDEITVREYLCAVLRSRSVRVIEAANGQNAFEQLRANPSSIDVVLLDLTMPGWSSEQTLDAMLQITPELPVVLMSGYSEKEVTRRFANRPIRGFLPKPFTKEQLDQILRQAIAAK
jgi:PAS domain S-box-containing protein